jgi:TatD DNase family protein
MTDILHLIDTHAHLDETDDVEHSLLEAKDSGIIAVIAVGQDYESNEKILELSARYSQFVFPALGLHPWSLANMSNAEVERNCLQIEENRDRIVAIGEVGLDYHKKVLSRVPKERQTKVFKEVLKLAYRLEKPISIHTRYAWKDGFLLTRETAIEKAVFHWYTGFSSVLRDIIAAGYYISATPAAEYHDEHRRAIKEVPAASLLLETDTPVTYGREEKFQARPSHTLVSLKAVSKIKGISESEVALRTTSNAITLFDLQLQS